MEVRCKMKTFRGGPTSTGARFCFKKIYGQNADLGIAQSSESKTAPILEPDIWLGVSHACVEVCS